MDILARYSIAGYLLLCVLYIYSPAVKDLFESGLEDKSVSYVLIGIVVGVPLGYLINQVSSFLFHLVPWLGLHRRTVADTFITREARKEMLVYEAQLREFDDDFDFRAWYVWRWTHLTINTNLIVSLVLGVCLSALLNGLLSGQWEPVYSLNIGAFAVLVFIVSISAVLVYNSHLLRWFISSMNQTILKRQLQSDTPIDRDNNIQSKPGAAAAPIGTGS